MWPLTISETFKQLTPLSVLTQTVSGGESVDSGIIYLSHLGLQSLLVPLQR